MGHPAQVRRWLNTTLGRIAYDSREKFKMADLDGLADWLPDAFAGADQSESESLEDFTARVQDVFPRAQAEYLAARIRSGDIKDTASRLGLAKKEQGYRPKQLAQERVTREAKATTGKYLEAFRRFMDEPTDENERAWNWYAVVDSSPTLSALQKFRPRYDAPQGAAAVEARIIFDIVWARQAGDILARHPNSASGLPSWVFPAAPLLVASAIDRHPPALCLAPRGSPWDLPTGDCTWKALEHRRAAACR